MEKDEENYFDVKEINGDNNTQFNEVLIQDEEEDVVKTTDDTKINFTLIMSVFIATLGGISYGYDLGIINGAILFIIDEFKLDYKYEGVIIAMFSVGGIIGSFTSSFICEILGRKKSILMSTIIFICGATWLALSHHYWDLIFGRLLLGIGVGISGSTVPAYLSEISPAKQRGMIMTCQELAITIGIFLSLVVSSFFGHYSLWRFMFAFCALPSLFQLGGIIFMPESPRWLISKGRRNGAILILQSIHSSNISNTLIEIDKDLENFKMTSFFDLFNLSIVPNLTIGLGVTFFQQASGQPTVLFYSSQIFSLIWKTKEISIISSAITTGVKMIVSFIVVTQIERIGRRKLLISGVIIMCLSLIGLGLSFLFFSSSANTPQTQTYLFGFTILVLIMVYLGAYSFSFGSIGWVLPSEIYPQNIRAKAMGLTNMVNWFMNLIISLTFPMLLHSIGAPLTFFLYAFLTFCALIFSYYLVIETKGKTLAEISIELAQMPIFSIFHKPVIVDDHDDAL